MPGSKEFFYEVNGKQQDSELHEPILAEADDSQPIADSTERMLEAGLDEATLRWLYHDGPAPEEKESSGG